MVIGSFQCNLTRPLHLFKVPSKKVSFSATPFQALFILLQKVPGKKVSFTSAPFQALFFFLQKVPGKGVSFTSAPFQALFIFSQKVPGKKESFTSTPFQALFIFFKKSAWQKKSAWEPGSKDPAYSALLSMAPPLWPFRIRERVPTHRPGCALARSSIDPRWSNRLELPGLLMVPIWLFMAILGRF